MYDNASIDYALIREGYIVVGTERANYFGNHENRFKVNNEKNNASGKVTQTVKRRMKTAIRLLLNTLKFSETLRQPTFLTLTLPAKQKTSDKEMNVRLNEFIAAIKRKTQLINYVWRAETQQNGNIHYHILCDCYINYKLAQYHWNQVIEKDGYVSDYRRNNHKNNNEAPNSTDIHSLKHINNTIRYIAKYITKDDDTKRRTCNSRIWGCSKELKDLKEPKIYIDGEVINEILDNQQDIIKHDYITIIKISIDYKTTPMIYTQLQKYYRELYASLYTSKIKQQIINYNYS